jgi:hypothetical protein
MLASMVEDSYVHGIVKLNGIKSVIVASLLLEYNYEFGLSLCKIVRSSVILLLPLFDV